MVQFWRPFLIVWALLAALSVCWSFTTPISASPDEPAHLVRAASVARGEWVGMPSPAGNVVTVPRYIANSQRETCFAFHPELSAGCVTPNPGGPGESVRATTTAGLYNPLYYLAVGWPSLLFHDDAGIYVMRVVSGILTTLFAALAFAVLWTLPRRLLTILGFAAAMTPALLFLSGSVNPSGLEATTVLALFAATLAIVLDPDSSARPGRLPGRAAIVAVAGAVAVNTRGLSPLWVLAAIAVPLILADRTLLRGVFSRRATWITVAVLGLATAGAFAWTLGSNSLLNAVNHPEATSQHFPGIGTNPLSGFWITLTRTVEYAHGVIGLFGWLDTPAPPEVFFVWATLIGALLLAASSVLRGRRLVFALVLLLAYVLLPPIVQGAYITGGGIIWQGRYAIPLFLCLVVGVSAVLDTALRLRAGLAWWHRLSAIAVVALAASHLYAFENTLRRYAVGAEGSLKVMLVGTPPWSPPGGVLPWLVAMTLLLAAAATITIRSLRAPPKTISAHG